MADSARATPVRLPEPPPRVGVPLPLSAPPVRHPAPTVATDRRSTDAARADAFKLKKLREYRRAHGLCFKCGKKWGHDHTCPTSVQLHVVEELLDLFGIDNFSDTQLPEMGETSDAVMAISLTDMTGGDSAKAFQLRA